MKIANYVMRDDVKYRVTLDTAKDIKIASTLNPECTNFRWNDIYAHITRNNEIHLYRHSISQWAGEDNSITPISHEVFFKHHYCDAIHDADSQRILVRLEQQDAEEL